MTRIILAGMAVLGLAACDPKVPDSGAGVGFGDYRSYQKKQAERDAKLNGQALPKAQAVSTEPLSATNPPATGGNTPADIARQTQASLDATKKQGSAGQVHASPSNPPPLQLNNPGLSDENNFDAVGKRRSIEADANLRKQQQAQYQQIQPTALAGRSGSGGPNIVTYALTTSHAKGTEMHKRRGFNLAARAERNCAKYPSPDKAQEVFLAKGGPNRDRLGLDPDGDGYACAWDPTPFRKAKAQASE